MTGYSYSPLIIVYYLPMLLLEGILLYISSYTSQWIFLGIIVVATIVSVVYFIRQILVKIELNETELHVINGKHDIVVPLDKIRSISKNKFSMGINYMTKKKMKTQYINSFLKEYDTFKEELGNNLSKREDYDQIIFID